MSDVYRLAPTVRATDGAWNAALADLVRRSEAVQPDELAAAANASCAALGIDLTLYLVDHEQRHLWPVPENGKATPASLALAGTVGGRAFTSVTTRGGVDGRGILRLWVPMVDGAERVGLAEVYARTAPADPDRLRRNAETLVSLLAHLISVKSTYGDALRRIRRTRSMHPSGELLLPMLPPLTFSCRQVVITAVLEPCYDVGGDAYDYAVDGSVARFAIFDSMGRGMPAALTSVAVLAATRAARREGRGLYDMARAADAVVAEQFARKRFTTGVLAELDTTSGLLRYINAGHPAPILMRRGRAVRTLRGGRRMPLGLDDAEVVVGEERLQAGDRLLLYTDGVTEPRDRVEPDSGLRWLADAARRNTAAGIAAPEVLRLLSHAVIGQEENGNLDDATLLLVEWPPVDRTRP